MNVIDDRLVAGLFFFGAIGWLSFFLHHHLILSAWLGFASLIFLFFAVLRWGLDSIYVPGLMAGTGLGYAVGVALWKHNLKLVLAFFIVTWFIGLILWWRLSPVPNAQKKP